MRKPGFINKRNIIVLSVLILALLTVHIVRAVGSDPGSSDDPIVSKSYVDAENLKDRTYIDTKVQELTVKLDEAGKKADDFQQKLDDANKKLDEAGKKIDDFQQKLDDVNKKLDEANKKIDELQQQGPGGQGSKYTVVNLKAGERLIADESTEIIIRGGKVRAIASKNGGLSNITSAKEIGNKISVPLNNLLLVSRTDGRGVKAVTESFMLVRGTYRIEK